MTHPYFNFFPHRCGKKFFNLPIAQVRSSIREIYLSLYTYPLLSTLSTGVHPSSALLLRVSAAWYLWKEAPKQLIFQPLPRTTSLWKYVERRSKTTAKTSGCAWYLRRGRKLKDGEDKSKGPLSGALRLAAATARGWSATRRRVGGWLVVCGRSVHLHSPPGGLHSLAHGVPAV